VDGGIVAGVIEPALQAAEAVRSANRPTSDLTAYDLYLRAYAMYSASHQRHMRQALALLEEAIARDPQYGPALGFAAFCCMQLASDAAAPDRDATRQKGVDFGRRAVELAENTPGVLANAAMALAFFGEDIDAMIALVDRALAFNPSYARGWHISGFLRLSAGPSEHAGLALRLSPRAQARFTSLLIGYALFFSRRFEEGRSAAPGCDRRFARFPGPLSISRGLLRPNGVARRSADYNRPAAGDHA